MLGDTWLLYLFIYLVGFILSLYFYKKNRKQYTFLMISFFLSFLSAAGFHFSFALLASDPTGQMGHTIENVINPILSLVDMAGLIMLLIAISHPITENLEKNPEK